MELWTKPNEPDFQGDVFTEHCLATAIAENPDAPVFFRCDAARPMGRYLDFRQLDLPGLFLAPTFSTVLANNSQDSFRVFESIQIQSWTVIDKDGNPAFVNNSDLEGKDPLE